MFWRTVRQRAEMVANGVRQLLGPSALDWLYNRDHVRWLVRRAREDGLEALQRTNAEEGFVSTPVDGVGAGFTARGRLSALLAPHTGFTHQIPYFARTDGAKPMEGSFGGVAVGCDAGDTDDGRFAGDDGEAVRWLPDEGFDHDVAYRPGTGILEVEYAGRDVDVTEAAYVYPGAETLVRDFAVENASGGRLRGAFRYHTRANANDNGQTFVVWNGDWNRLRAADGLEWRDLQGPYSLRVDARVERAEAGGGSGEPGASSGATGVGFDGDSRDGVSADPVEYGTARGLALGDVAVGRYLDGRLSVPLDLPPGGVERVSVFLRAGEDVDPALPSFEPTGRGRQAAVADWWDDWLDDVETDGVPKRFARPYVRSAVVLGMLADPETGSLAAAPNLQPMYYPSWVRDGAFVAVALAKVGKPDLARQWLVEFCPAVQERDGSFKQCYDATGEFAGVVEVEHDQQPLFAWAVAEIYEETGDGAFVEETWPAVRDALEYTRAAMDDAGLLEPTPDVAEYPSDVRQSLWTNTFAYRGFLAGAALAEVVGSDPAPYRRAAETVGDAVASELFGGDGYATYRDVTGSHKDPMPYDACAIYPTGWAGSYGETERLSADLREAAAVDGGEWIPGTLLLAATFYRLGEVDVGDRVLDEVREETTAAGHLVEQPDAEEGHHFASPLAWSHAAFIHAVEAAPGVMADGGEGTADADDR